MTSLPGRPSPTNTSLPPEVTALALIQKLRREGWLFGVPVHLRAWAERVDATLCASLACPCCRRRGLAFRPFHRGRAYRVIGACEQCGYGEEF